MVFDVKAPSPAAKFEFIAPALYEPLSANPPVIVIAPATVSFVVGELVPIPTLPDASLTIPPLPTLRVSVEASPSIVLPDVVRSTIVSVPVFNKPGVVIPVVPFSVIAII